MAQNRSEVIVATGVNKVYRVFTSHSDRLRHALGLGGHPVQFHALSSVDLRVAAGEAVGIVGENGAGKTTLLKIISGTTRATTGEVEVRGRLASILELGTGFHPEFTGRDNALLYGAMLGFDRAQMTARLGNILDFAEIGDFIDHPVRNYSTGMVMRLAFAVATHVDAEILVIDEALAVGDGYFQKKCIDRILDIKERGATILFVSHAMYHVAMFCDRAIWLDNGSVRQEGPTKQVVEAYEAHLLHRGKRQLSAGREPRSEAQSDGLRVGRVARVQLRGADGQDEFVLKPHDPLTFDLEVESTEADERYHLGLSLDAPDGRCLLSLSTQWDGQSPLSGCHHYALKLVIPSVPVASGRYSVSAFLLDETGLHVHDQVVSECAVRIDNPRWTSALLDVPHSWEGY